MRLEDPLGRFSSRRGGVSRKGWSGESERGRGRKRDIGRDHVGIKGVYLSQTALAQRVHFGAAVLRFTSR